MNKPAPKEPSMDEILSSIRQIIADDDASATPRKPVLPSVPRSFAPTPPEVEPEHEPEPLSLSSEQILRETAAEDARPGTSFESVFNRTTPSIAAPPTPTLVDPEDITFDVEEEEEAPEPVRPAPPVMPVLERPPQRPVSPPAAPQPAPRPAARVAQAAPMPDAHLARDMAEQLLEPATQSAVKTAFTRLNGLSTMGSGVTLEEMMREMLRPMLKEWLDENLPSLVERMVEKEIARVSRGG